MSKQWYVVRVQSGREDKVRENLIKQIKSQGLDEKIPNVIVPTEKVTEIRGGKKTVREKKTYPGYLMLEMDLDDQTWFLVRETPGIGDFLGLRKPVPMAAHEVERMISDAAAPEDKPKLKIDFQKGDSVRIKEGSFENFEGVMEEVVADKGLVRVTITIFGRATPVELEYWQIEKI